MKAIAAQDLHPLALGCALLGSGGGGDPACDLPIAEYTLEQSCPVNLLSLEELPDDALVVPIAFIGAPLIRGERLPSGREFEVIINHLRQSGKKLVLMAGEIGGGNGLVPITAAARLQLPLLDADTLGRAFPELQMSTCTLHGVIPSPAYLADGLGNLVIVHAKSGAAMEHLGRQIAMSMGSNCAAALYLMHGKKAKTTVIPGTVSKALALGHALLQIRKTEGDLVQQLELLTQGICLAQGIITNVQQEVKEGFLQGSVIITDATGAVELVYQNEYLLAKRREEILASTPDILALIEQDSKTPLAAEALRYGLKVALIAFPAPSIWQTEAGLALVGPSYFGYSIPYRPVKKETLV